MICEYEDSTWCFWNAAEQGNGLGTSFVSLWEGMVIPMNGIGFGALFIASVVVFLYATGTLDRWLKRKAK